jgi:acetate---CoA ligase (ADP-forming)
MTERTAWDRFLDPTVVCVVGASGDPSRIGGRLVRYSIESGFAGRIIPVNPNRESVFDIPTVARLADVDVVPDWVVIALPREQTPDAVEQAARIGARNVSIAASGFAEVDATGRALQEHVLGIARAHGMRLLGPNSNGFMNVDSGAYFAFTPVIDSARPDPGEVAIVTQSAALGTYLINCFRTIGLGIKYWIHTGNEADLTVLEMVRALAERHELRAVAMCFEVVRDMPDLYRTLHSLAAHGVATAVLQAGLSPTGKRASEAHTAALIGDDARLLGDLFRQAGVFTATSVAALANFIQAAVNYSALPAEPRIGVVTTSGGIGVLAADALESRGITLPALSASLRQQIRSYAPFAQCANPVDTTAQVINEPTAFRRIVEDCTDSAELDLVAVFIAHGLAGSKDPTIRQLLAVAASRQPPDVALAALGVITADAARELQRVGVGVFSEPVALADSLRGYLDSARNRLMFLRHERVRSVDRRAPKGSPFVNERRGDYGQIIDEIDSKDLLRREGAEVVTGMVVSSPAAAQDTANRLGYPIVMKLVGAALPHKASCGALRLNLWNDDAVRRAFDELADVNGRVGQGFRILVERQESGREVFLGCVRQGELGVLVGIGPGGSNVEQTRAVRWLWPPVPEQDIREALGDGLSEPHARQLTQLANTMTLILTGQQAIQTVETNPILLTPDGRAVVVDALVELAADMSAEGV